MACNCLNDYTVTFVMIDHLTMAVLLICVMLILALELIE